MSNLMSARARRGLAAGVATVVGASALSLLAVAPAQAAPTGSLQWGISQQFTEHLSTPTASGVTENAGVYTFPEASTSVAGGTTTINYTGSIKRAFINAGSELYSVTFATPRVEINATGSATLTAVVSSANAAFGPTPAASIAPTRVTVLQVPTTGSLATAFTAAASQDFAADLFNGLVPGVQAHFRQTSTATPPVDQPKKRPSGFTATGTEPSASPAVSVKTTVNGSKAVVAISGTNFVGGDDNYNGVYVGVAPAGGLPDVTKFDTSKFVASDWVTAGAIKDGSFTRNLPVDLTKLVAGTKYALYTWQAHKHSTEALDTQTALSIAKFVAPPVKVVKAKSVLKPKWNKKPTAKKGRQGDRDHREGEGQGQGHRQGQGDHQVHRQEEGQDPQRQGQERQDRGQGAQGHQADHREVPR